jgi:hypothetical protein
MLRDHDIARVRFEPGADLAAPCNRRRVFLSMVRMLFPAFLA